MINTIEIHWKLMGAKLATLSEKDQADFFTGFIKELMHYETTMHIQLQLFAANKILSEKDKENLEDYLPCLWIKD